MVMVMVVMVMEVMGTPQIQLCVCALPHTHNIRGVLPQEMHNCLVRFDDETRI